MSSIKKNEEISVVVAPRESLAVAPRESFSLAPRNLAEAMKFAELIASSELAPKDYRGKPANIVVAVAMGADLGLSPMQSLQNIAVIEGRPSVWGDAMLAICRAHRDFEDIAESIEGTGDNRVAICKVKRRGQSLVESKFSVQDAKTAGLWGRNVWSKYPDRMLKNRARGFALRDAFTDALKGVISAEEARDISFHESQSRSTPNRVVDIKPVTVMDGSFVEPLQNDEETFYKAVDDIDEAKNTAELTAIGEWIKNAPLRSDSLAEVRQLYKEKLSFFTQQKVDEAKERLRRTKEKVANEAPAKEQPIENSESNGIG